MFWYLSLVLIVLLADDGRFEDYLENIEFNWEYLKSNNPYTLVNGRHTIHFAFGEDLKQTCQGQNASVIMFSQDNDECEILGRHQINNYKLVEVSDILGIEVYYKGGSLCRDRLWGDILRRTDFKFICSDLEENFFVMSSVKSCRTIIEKRGKAGCPTKVIGKGGQTLIIAGVLLLVFLMFCWMLFDILSDEEYSRVFMDEGVTGVVSYGKNKVLSFDDKRKYYEV